MIAASPDWEAMLRAELAAVEAGSAATEADRRPVELDQQSVGRLSRMDALQGQAMAAATEARRRARAGALRAALSRLQAGEFGWCETCGEPIPAARLATDPCLTRCVSCAGGRGPAR
ncbi:MAG: TraR/DksA family transcriptional regulator [Gemmobacter sp.]